MTMPSSTSEQNTRVRARQLQRLNERIKREGHLPYTDQLTPEDLQLANRLEPNWKVVPDGEVDIPEEWTTKAGSLSCTLMHFRKNVKLLLAKQELPTDDVPETPEQTSPAPPQTQEKGDREGDGSHSKDLIQFSEPPKPTTRQENAKLDASPGTKTAQDVLWPHETTNERRRRLQVEKQLAEATRELQDLEIKWSGEKQMLQDKLNQAVKRLEKTTAEYNQTTKWLNQAMSQLNHTRTQLGQTTVRLNKTNEQLEMAVMELDQVKKAKERGEQGHQQERTDPLLTDENYETLRKMMRKSKGREG
ncbi:hypothetical protein ACHAPT_013591 [Fusarium lateritium]